MIGLAHPEPITIPRFLRDRESLQLRQHRPADALVVNWALARLGAAGAGDGAGLDVGRRGPAAIPALASDLYRQYRGSREPTEYLGGGLVVDVWSGEDGIRFASADTTSMDESTGVPAAAGIGLMLGGRTPEEPVCWRRSASSRRSSSRCSARSATTAGR